MGRRPARPLTRNLYFNHRFKKYSWLLTLVSKHEYRLQTRECAIFRSDGSRKRGIAFPATSLLSFLVAQERKCPAGMRRLGKPVPRGTSGQRTDKRPSTKDMTIKPTFNLQVKARSQRGRNRRVTALRRLRVPEWNRGSRPYVFYFIDGVTLRSKSSAELFVSCKIWRPSSVVEATLRRTAVPKSIEPAFRSPQ